MPGRANRIVSFAFGLVAMAWSLLLPSPATAHPHAWIDLKDVVLFNDKGEVAGLRERWKFDEFYTLYAIEDFDKDGDGKPDDDQLWKLAVVNLDSLAEYDYFTYFKVDDVQPAYAKVKDYDTFMEDGRLVLIFTVNLLVPADPRHHTVSYGVYDPTYYIEVTHVPKSEDPITFEGPAPAGCSFKLQLPDPDADLTFFAASIDQTQSSSDGLGASFAENVLIQCK
jgi:ABC-type uncharacterized transport system substrate-binding protein